MAFAGSEEFIEQLQARKFLSSKNIVNLMQGEDVCGQYFVENGFSTPVLVPETKGLRIKIPSQDFDLQDIIDNTNGEEILDVILSRKQNVRKLKLCDLVDCFYHEPREEILNSLSYEFTHTKLSSLVSPPHVVSELSLVENIWPDEEDENYDDSEMVNTKPNVQKYCIMSMGDSYTDFHVDFGGSSVWYHVLWGSKTFYLIPPTPENLDMYWEWYAIPDNRCIYFPDRIEKSSIMRSGDEEISVAPVYRLKVFSGQTIFLPAGWIHAVYTPEDSLVFGGNFLTKLTVPIQLSVYRMEEQTKTLDKFMFPYFEKLHWLLADYLLASLKNHKENQTIPEYFVIDAAICLIFTLEKWIKKRALMPEEERANFLPDIKLLSTKSYQDLVRDLDRLIKTSIPKSYKKTLSPRKKSRTSSNQEQETEKKQKKRGRPKRSEKQPEILPQSPPGFRPIGGGIAAQMRIDAQNVGRSPPPEPNMAPNRAASPDGNNKKSNFSHLIGLPPIKKTNKPSIAEKIFSPTKGKKKRRDNEDHSENSETEATTDFNSSDSEEPNGVSYRSKKNCFDMPTNRRRPIRTRKPNRRFMSSGEEASDAEAAQEEVSPYKTNRIISGQYISNFAKSKSDSSDYSPTEDVEVKTEKKHSSLHDNDPPYVDRMKSSHVNKSTKKVPTDAGSKKPKSSVSASARERLAKRLGIK